MRDDVMTRRIVVALLVSWTAAVAPLMAHEGHEHKILGTVTMAAADHVMLKDRSGKDVTVKVTSTTKIKSKPAMKVHEIQPGTRVVVTALQAKDKSFTAKSIEVGPSPPAAPRKDNAI
jgi:hypothetical protein